MMDAFLCGLCLGGAIGLCCGLLVFKHLGYFVIRPKLRIVWDKDGNNGSPADGSMSFREAM